MAEKKLEDMTLNDIVDKFLTEKVGQSGEWGLELNSRLKRWVIAKVKDLRNRVPPKDIPLDLTEQVKRSHKIIIKWIMHNFNLTEGDLK